MKRILFVSAVILLAFLPVHAAEIDVDTLKNPAPNNKDTISKGNAIFIERCAVCHGVKGDGNGPSADGFQVAPWSFLDGPALEVSDGYLFAKTKNGGVWFEMPPFGLVLKDEDIWNTVRYIRSLAKKR